VAESAGIGVGLWPKVPTQTGGLAVIDHVGLRPAGDVWQSVVEAHDKVPRNKDDEQI
jgi:hypothetical protein